MYDCFFSGLLNHLNFRLRNFRKVNKIFIFRVKLARKNGSLYAIKFSTTNKAYSNELLKKIFEKEAQILMELNHPNIIKL